MSLPEPAWGAPALPHCITPPAPAWAGGREGLQGMKIHELSLLLTDKNGKYARGPRDVRAVHTKGLGRGQKAALPFPALTGLQDFRSKGAAAPSWSGEAVPRSWLILHGAQCCPEETLKMQRERERRFFFLWSVKYQSPLVSQGASGGVCPSPA